VRPTALLDVRFRQALAHAIDKQAIVEVMLDGEPGIAETLIPKEAEYYPDLDRVLTKHPFDPRRAEQLLAELGLAKDAEGFYRQDGNRISLGLISLGGYDPREALVLSDSWKRVGIEAPIRALSPAEQLDGEIGSTYPSLAITHVGIQADLLLYNPLVYFTAALVSSPATRWLGRNRGAYADPEMERLAELYAASLDRNVRNQSVIQGMKLLSEQAAYFPLYYGFDVVAHAGSLAGPPGALRETALWNAESWSWK
jgi:peptide/nickel transport system substrate-binding protein